MLKKSVSVQTKLKRRLTDQQKALRGHINRMKTMGTHDKRKRRRKS